MRRRLFTLLSAVSLVICVATCVLWVRSYRVNDGLQVDYAGTAIDCLDSWRGRLVIVRVEPLPGTSRGWITDLRLSPVASQNWSDGPPPPQGSTSTVVGPLRVDQIPEQTLRANLTRASAIDDQIQVNLRGVSRRLAGVCPLQPARRGRPTVEVLLERSVASLVASRNKLSVSSQTVLRTWCAVAVWAVLPVAWITSRVRSVRAKRHSARTGTCPACGYDLRASPGRCPECGAVAAAAGKSTI